MVPVLQKAREVIDHIMDVNFLLTSKLYTVIHLSRYTMSFKPLGVILMPYARVGGYLKVLPSIISKVQTDGSFRYGSYARIAAILGTKKRMIPIEAHSSTETEWASVALGLELALENNETVIGIENDNMSVIVDLSRPTMLKHAYARHYKNEIQRLAADTAWTGVRWIPRALNRADGLFRV